MIANKLLPVAGVLQYGDSAKKGALNSEELIYTDVIQGMLNIGCLLYTSHILDHFVQVDLQYRGLGILVRALDANAQFAILQLYGVLRGCLLYTSRCV